MPPPADLYATIHHIPSLENAKPEDLRRIIKTFPVIDNHAHNLFVEQYASIQAEYPFELITSEAVGVALIEDSPSSLAHIRAVEQLSELLHCRPTMSDVKEARDTEVGRSYDAFIKRCLKGTHAILMDDGLSAPPGYVQPLKKHEKFVPHIYRIVRIEKIAEEILVASIDWTGMSTAEDILVPQLTTRDGTTAYCVEPTQQERFLSTFKQKFRQAISEFADDPQVRGFKSVICYRTGLDIEPTIEPLLLQDAWHRFLRTILSKPVSRIKFKEINDELVRIVCEVLSARAEENPDDKLPFQFHSGLGDTDINLLKSNPAHMQPLIEAYPQVNFVLLHSAYPYTRDAGYLAAHYPNAYLDIGEIFPILSMDGQESVLRQALELVPHCKILWSTDGRYYPETYWLANKQFRQVLEKVVMGDPNIWKGAASVQQGIDAVVNIFFWNSNKLYKLEEEKRYPELLRACGRGAVIQGTTSFGESQTSQLIPSSPSSSELASAEAIRDLGIWDEFHKKHPNIKYVWVQFLDYTATMRQRIVPVAQYREHIRKRSSPMVPLAVKGLLQNDSLSPGASATGQFLLISDLSTLAPNYGINSPSATVQTWWGRDFDPEETAISPILQGCPRWTLFRQVNRLKEQFDIDILMGFEVEIVFMKPILNEAKNDFIRLEPLNMVHSWCNMTTQQLDTLPMIEEIVDTLNEAGIPLSQFHAESAPGQWEFPLPCYPPLKAVDTLYRARDIIRNIAKKHGLRATLYPRPFNNACGTASHAHISINGPGAAAPANEDAFLAGMLKHLPSILAFSLPIEESYARVVPGIWSGGVYVAWGTQNKEVPLRKCGKGHWEFKTVDGIGNMYLSMSALLAAGYNGLKKNLPLREKDCVVDASLIGAEERAELGITMMLPDTLDKSLDALKRDTELKRRLGPVVESYVEVKTVEMKKLRALGGLEDEKRRVWLMSRY
ncbi:glutamine synthetase [Tirmania nivea]|nr:glutamine synthetase [Tirmania nivea]